MAEMLSEDRTLKVPEVALGLRCSEWRVYRLIAAGELQAFHVGRLVRVRPSAIVEFIERQK